MASSPRVELPTVSLRLGRLTGPRASTTPGVHNTPLITVNRLSQPNRLRTSPARLRSQAVTSCHKPCFDISYPPLSLSRYAGYTLGIVQTIDTQT